MSADALLLSYAQNREDFHLNLLFEGRNEGFYIDVGGGHVVADNVSFFFYARGWRGIVVEPQEKLAQAYALVRPRDTVVTMLAGQAEGSVDFFEAEQFHGLSTTVAAHAETAAGNGIAMRRRSLPVTTLAALCAAHAPEGIDFLKIDVEGAEAEVLAGNDWTRFRPRVIVLEAVAPWSMADASAAFEPLLVAARYRCAFFDGLNRFYLAEEAEDLAARFPSEPVDWGAMRHLGEYGRAPEDATHPDHALARTLPAALLDRLTLLSAQDLRPLLPPGIDPDSAETRAALARIAAGYDGGFI